MRNTVCQGLAALCLIVMASPAQSQVVQRFDPIYEHRSPGDQHLRGDAIWIVFARCAAVNKNADLLVENYREDLARKRAQALPEHVTMFLPDPAAEASLREGAARREAAFIRRGLEIMAQDRPGQNVEAEFRAQIARELAELQAYPYTRSASTEQMGYRCDSFSRAMGQHGLTSARSRVRGPGIPVSVPLTLEMIARIRARDGR